MAWSPGPGRPVGRFLAAARVLRRGRGRRGAVRAGSPFGRTRAAAAGCPQAGNGRPGASSRRIRWLAASAQERRPARRRVPVAASPTDVDLRRTQRCAPVMASAADPTPCVHSSSLRPPQSGVDMDVAAHPMSPGLTGKIADRRHRRRTRADLPEQSGCSATSEHVFDVAGVVRAATARRDHCDLPRRSGRRRRGAVADDDLHVTARCPTNELVDAPAAWRPVHAHRVHVGAWPQHWCCPRRRIRSPCAYECRHPPRRRPGPSRICRGPAR